MSVVDFQLSSLLLEVSYACPQVLSLLLSFLQLLVGFLQLDSYGTLLWLGQYHRLRLPAAQAYYCRLI